MNKANTLFWTIILSIVVVYGYFIHRVAVNLPISDDYDLIRVKYVFLTENLTWWQRLRELLQPENDHRILIPRSVALLNYQIEGFINYRSLIAVVNVSLLGLMALWGSSLRKVKLPIGHLIPILLCYLSAFTFDVTLWGINGMQHTTLNLLVFTSLYLAAVATSMRGHLLALVLAWAATFTNGNGFLVFPSAIVFLALVRRWPQVAIWCVGMAGALLAYFLDYRFGQATKVAWSGEFLQNLIVSLGALSGGWVAAFKGATWLPVLWGAAIVGFGILGWLMFWFCQKWWKTQPHTPPMVLFWIGIFLFSVFTIGIIAISRGGTDVYSIFTSRYSLYPLHLLTLAYIALLLSLPQHPKALGTGSLIFSILFWLMSYYNYAPSIDLRRRNLIADDFNWRQHHQLTMSFRSWLADFFSLPAYEKRVFKLNDFKLVEGEKYIIAPFDSTQKRISIPLTLSTTTDSIDFFNHPQIVHKFSLGNTTLPQPELGRNEGVYLVLKSPQNRTYLLPTWPKQGGRKQFFTTGKVYKAGFDLTLYNENFKPDTYQIGVLQPQNQSFTLQYTPYRLKIDSTHVQLLTKR
ncbi:MAG: hypothetical protein ACK4GN_09565 [Runella sp.]